MSAKSALIVWGGWDGHEPQKVAEFFWDLLLAEGFEVDISTTLDAFLDPSLPDRSLVIPIFTMSEITGDQRQAICKAVAENGVGLAGCHGGMCDAFRNDTEWQFMTGGQWVAHPGNDGVTYQIKIDRNNPHEITDGIPDFEVVSEQYYLHTDPGNNVLAYTEFPTPGVSGPHEKNPCRMPQVWTKSYGKGRVFYTALGHHCDVLQAANPRQICRRGFLWSART